MSISFGSIQTGLPKDIVQQIMQAEQIPIRAMEQKISKFNEKKALVNELIKLTEALRASVNQSGDIRSLTEYLVDTNEEIIDVSANKLNVAPGSYQFEVLQLARKSSAFSSGFSDPEDSYVGVGYIEYTLPDGETRDLYIDSDNSSLRSIASLINKTPDLGMRASVINDGSGSETPWRLLLALSETGEKNKAQFPSFYFVDGEEDLILEEERPAQNAVVKLEGFELELEGNKTSDLIPGLTIDLKKAAEGVEFPIIIKEDISAISGKVIEVIESINGVLGFIKQQNTMDENTDTSRTLGGDLILQTLESRIRNVVFKPIQTNYGVKRLGDLGIKFQKNGLLALEESVFNSSVNENIKLASEILTGFYNEEDRTKSLGFMDHLKNLVNNALSFPNGILQGRKKSIQNNINQVDKKISNTQRLLAQKEVNLKRKFAALEETMGRIKSQGFGLNSIGAGAANTGASLG